MEYMEYVQLEKALKYIEQPASGENFLSLLNKFTIKGKRVFETATRLKGISYFRRYGSGCTERQMNLIKGILLSAEYNYKKTWDELMAAKPQLIFDMENNKYKGKSLEDLEKLRIEAADKIKKSDNLVEKLNIVMDNSKIINEGLKRIFEWNAVKEAAVKDMVFDAAMYMIEDGISLTQITSCLQADLLDIYYLAESMNRPFLLSPEEEEGVKRAKAEAAEKNTLQNKNTAAMFPAEPEAELFYGNYAYM